MVVLSTHETSHRVKDEKINIPQGQWILLWEHRLPSSKYVVYATACAYRELYAKIADRKNKNCVDNYLIWNKVFLPQMCRELASCADFKAILTPFSGVI